MAISRCRLLLIDRTDDESLRDRPELVTTPQLRGTAHAGAVAVNIFQNRRNELIVKHIIIDTTFGFS